MSSSPILAPLSIPKTLTQITQTYHPKLIALLNQTTELRLAKIHGDFIWHSHPETDELFYILEGGPLKLRIREKKDDEGSEKMILLEKGDLFVVPRGVQHCPGADEEVSVLFVEQAGTRNTGDAGVTERTVEIEDARTGVRSEE